MAAALAHRGPDDVGIHVAGPVGLAQTRLSIIDLERGHQPMVEDGLALAANGEIYNFVELRPRLEARGRRFATSSDSETILHAYALDGLGALGSLHGMFAFALHDGRRGETVLARDRLGIKPLYYARLPDRLFASEQSAAGVWPGERGSNPALVQYLQNRFNTGTPRICGSAVSAGHRRPHRPDRATPYRRQREPATSASRLPGIRPLFRRM
jgi:asparagine synthase (glutamine-hydrolysing)